MAVEQRNLFDLLDDDVEDNTVVAPPPSKAEPADKAKAKKEAKPAAPAAESKKPAANAIDARLRGDSAPSGGGRGEGGRGRGGRGGRGGGRSGEARGQDQSEPAQSDIDPTAVQQNRTVRGLRGGYAGPHTGRGQPRRNDRHSSTHDGETEKRHGAGKGNWGTEADTIQEGKLEAANSTPEAGLPAAGEAPAAAAEGEEKETPAADEKPAPPPEPKELSWDEYEKQLAEKKATSTLNKAGAKAVEVDMSGFKGMTKKEVSAPEEEEDVLELKNKKTYGARKTGEYTKEVKAKETLKTNFQVGERAGAGDRGGYGGGGRGGPRPEGRGGRDRPYSGGRGEGGPRGPPREGGGERSFVPRGGGEGRGEGRGPYRGGRGGGERPDGGRGTPEGGRGRGGGRSAAPAIDDNSAFPSLG